MDTLCQTLCNVFGIHFLSLRFLPVLIPFALAIKNLFWLLKQRFSLLAITLVGLCLEYSSPSLSGSTLLILQEDFLVPSPTH